MKRIWLQINDFAKFSFKFSVGEDFECIFYDWDYHFFAGCFSVKLVTMIKRNNREAVFCPGMCGMNFLN